MVEITSHVGCLIVNKVAGKFASGYQREIERFVRLNGLEWTTKRLKAVWNAALHLKAGSNEAAIQVYQSNSIAYRKDTLCPKGNIGRVVQTFVETRKPSAIRRWAAVLRFYTSFQLPKVSWSQFKEHKSSINDGPTVPLDQIQCLAGQIVRSVGKSFPKPRKVVEDDRYAEKLRGTARYFSTYRLPKVMSGVPYASMALSLVTNEYVPATIDWDTPCYEMREYLRNLPDQSWHSDYVGKISFLMEQGCKARVVAQPSAWLQLAFRPLQAVLASLNRELEESCVEDQEKGIWRVLDALSQGKDVWSVDLTSATDRLPLALQTELLRSLGLSNYAEAIEDVVKRPWMAEWRGMVEPFYFRTGQPMGLYGSFPLLNLSNIALGRYAEVVTHGRIEHNFSVLGDDIVFTDSEVAATYTSLLEKLGVQVSPTKCRKGNIAEFAGFVVLPTNQGHCCFRPYKVPTRNELTNPVEFLHALGVKVRGLSKAWARRFEVYRLSIPDLSLTLEPLISDAEVGPVANTFRADNRVLISLCNELIAYDKSIPDLGTNTKINRKPLFRERRMWDFYGYNPEAYKKEDIRYSRMLHLPGVSVYRSLDDNPVVREKTVDVLDRELSNLELELSKATSIQDQLRISKEIASLKSSWPTPRRNVGGTTSR